MSGRGRGLRPRKVKLPSCSTADDSCTSSLRDSDACFHCHVKDLVSKLQKFKKIDDACRLLGIVQGFDLQLKDYTAFFMQLMPNVYRVLEDAEEHLLRVVLLHIIELVAANGDLPPSTLAYYNAKVVVPESSADAFKAAMKFVQENSCSPSTICSCLKNLASGEAHSPGEVRSPEVMNESGLVGVEASASLDGDSNHSGATFGHKEPNNNNVDDEHLAEVFGKCMESALSHCFGGNSAVSQPLEELVKAEEEEGPQDATLSQVLPSTTAFELLSSFRGNACGEGLRSGNEGLSEDDQVQEGENKRLKEKKTKKFERLLKVRDDVTVHLSSDSKDHLQEVYDVLSLHFTPSPALPENAAAIHDHFNQKVRAYSREFLLECSSNVHSRKIPSYWPQLSEQFPGICLKEGRIFTADSCLASPCWRTGSNLKRANSSPYPDGAHANGIETDN